MTASQEIGRVLTLMNFFVKNKKYNIIMMSTKYGLVVREGKKMINKYQKEICTNSSIHNPFFITNCIEEMWTTTMIFVLTAK